MNEPSYLVRAREAVAKVYPQHLDTETVALLRSCNVTLLALAEWRWRKERTWAR